MRLYQIIWNALGKIGNALWRIPKKQTNKQVNSVIPQNFKLHQSENLFELHIYLFLSDMFQWKSPQRLHFRAWTHCSHAAESINQQIYYGEVLAASQQTLKINTVLESSICPMRSYPKCFLSAIFIIFLYFHQMIALQKLWKMLFVSSKKLFSFSRYSIFCISVLASFSTSPPLV